MKLRRCFSLLLAVLLVVMSFAFSASKAWANDTPPSLSGNYIGFTSYEVFCIDPSDNSYYWGDTYSINSTSSLYTPLETRLAPYSYRVRLNIFNEFSVGSSGCTFRGYFRSPYPVYGVYLHVWNENFTDLSIVPCSVTAFSDNLYYYELFLDGSLNPSLSVSGVDFWFFEPDSSFNPPKEYPRPFISDSFYVSFSKLFYQKVTVSSSDKYQNNVSSGLKDIGNSVKKGFSAVTGAIGGAASAIGDKLGQVKDAVVQQGQAVAEKVTEVKEAVIEKTTEIKDTVVEKTDEVKQTIIEKLAALGNFIIDGLKELFIPSEDYFPGLFERLNTFFSDRFGFLYFPIEHFISLIGKLMSLQDVAPSIAIPELSYEGQVFIPAMTYTFDFLSQEPFKTVHDYYLLAIDAALIAAFIGLLHRKYEEVMRN